MMKKPRRKIDAALKAKIALENRRARRVLVEGAWTYRFVPGWGKTLLDRARNLPKTVREVAWKAQLRLCRRYRMLVARGKRSTVVTTAIAREMAAFLGAIAHEAAAPRAA
jgi:hypothetical protein